MMHILITLSLLFTCGIDDIFDDGMVYTTFCLADLFGSVLATFFFLTLVW